VELDIIVNRVSRSRHHCESRSSYHCELRSGIVVISVEFSRNESKLMNCWHFLPRRSKK